VSAKSATPLDSAILSGVLDLARQAPGAHPEELKRSIGACLMAFDRGQAEGRVTDRLVRATFSALEQTARLRIDHVPNPFEPPHNLSWYFSACACPPDVRQFATRLSNSHIRVWSVAQNRSGWVILAQVFGASSQAEAVRAVELEADVPAKSLMHHAMSGAMKYTFAAQNVDRFMNDHARGLLEKQGRGHFVEIALDRRFS
jgi:hypothetical protein